MFDGICTNHVTNLTLYHIVKERKIEYTSERTAINAIRLEYQVQCEQEKYEPIQLVLDPVHSIYHSLMLQMLLMLLFCPDRQALRLLLLLGQRV